MPISLGLEGETERPLSFFGGLLASVDNSLDKALDAEGEREYEGGRYTLSPLPVLPLILLLLQLSSSRESLKAQVLLLSLILLLSVKANSIIL